MILKEPLLVLTLCLTAALTHAQDVKKGLPADFKGTKATGAADYETAKRNTAWSISSDFQYEDDKSQMAGDLTAGPDEVSGDEPKPIVVGHWAKVFEKVGKDEKGVYYITNTKHVLVAKAVIDILNPYDVSLETMKDSKKQKIKATTDTGQESDIANFLSKNQYL